MPPDSMLEMHSQIAHWIVYVPVDVTLNVSGSITFSVFFPPSSFFPLQYVFLNVPECRDENNVVVFEIS